MRDPFYVGKELHETMCTTMRNNMMEVISIILHLINGEAIKVPVTLMLSQGCSDKVMELVTINEEGNEILYKGKTVFAYYCKTTKGEWVK